MRRIAVALLAALTALTVTAVAVPSGAAAASLAKGRYVVVFEQERAPGKFAKALGGKLGFQVEHSYKHALDGFAAAMSAADAEALAANPAVASVERDRVVHATAQAVPTGINRVDADLSPTADIDGVDEGVDVDVAVLDTGADLDHPDLNVFRSTNCSLLGLNANDQNGHGTHTAGTVGARDNDIGVVGVAPGARLWVVKVLNAAGVGLGSDIICGIDYVTANAGSIEVANMSLGGAGSDDGNCGNSDGDSQHQAICESVAAGVTYAVAAGNDHEDASGFTPAAYDEVITVSALADFNGQPGGGAAATCRADVDDTFADFSNFGEDVDLIAPGTCINSTYLNAGYNAGLSGTSMASPHVAGAAALYKAANPSAGPTQVRSALQSAGNLGWTWPSEDGDGTQERLLNVGGF
jgi:subtilisin